MATKEAVWGIDVGQCALKAIKLQAAGDKVEVLAFDVVEHEKILSHPEVDAPAAIKAAIEKFLSRNDIKGDLCAIGVPGQQTLSRFTKLPPVEPKRIPDIVKFEAGQQIPFDMEEVVWDYQTFSEPDSPDVEVGIFAIRKELIRAHLAYFTAANIEPMLVQPSPLALYNAIRFDLAKAEKATILLDIGAQATDLIVMEGSTIWSRPVPIGGNAFTEALVKAFKLSHDKAENLKRTAATTKYAKNLFQAMRPVFADLISEIQRSIGFYTATHRESEVTRILGVGNAFKLPGLQKFMQQNLQIEVDRFTEFKRVVPSQVAKSQEYLDAAPSLAVAFGLALQGLGMAPISSSLLPPEIAKQIVWRRKTPWFAAAAACLLASAGVIWVSNSRAQASLSELSGAGPVVIPSTQAAEAALTAAPTGQNPGQYARTVIAAVEKLNNDYNQAATPKGPGSQALEMVRKTSTFTSLVPRMVHQLHVSLSKLAPGIPDAKTGADYLARINEARRKRDQLANEGVPASDPRMQALSEIIDRAKRKELWMQKFSMQYYPDVGQAPEVKEWVELSQKDRDELNGKSGWILTLNMRTTNPEPSGWIEHQVLPALIRDSIRDKQGFYFAAARLRNAAPITQPLDETAGASYSSGAPTGGGVQAPAGGGARGGRGLFGNAPPEGPRAPAPEAPPGEGGGPAKFEWSPDQDPLTLEKYVGNDSFVYTYVVAVKGDPPERLLATTRPAAPPPQPADKNAKPAKPAGRPGR